MKRFLILLLACLPLALLTARSFVELRAIDPGGAGVAEDIGASAAAAARAPTEPEKAAVAGLAGVDLLAADPVPELARLPAESPLGDVAPHWLQWTAARRHIDEYLAVERTAARADAENLKESLVRLQKLKNRLETAEPPRQVQLLALVDDRLASLRQEIARQQRDAETAALLGKARAALQSNRYDQATTLGQEWLAKYGETADAAAVRTARGLQEQADFHRQRELSSARLRVARTPAEQEAVLAAFLQRFPDRPTWGSVERSVLQKCTATLERVRAQRLDDEQFRTAEEELRALRGSLPPRLEDRLAAAAGILARRPGRRVKPLLRGEIVQWIAEGIPEKRLAEDRLLQEAQTAGHEILRGYFRKVQTPDGSLGYKRYATLEQLQNPVLDVGTYRSDQFLDNPGPSLPRKSLVQYSEGRQRLLASPERKPSWAELAALCEALEVQLDQYRQKPGSSQEPLSFAAEAALLKALPAGPAWTTMETMWSP